MKNDLYVNNADACNTIIDICWYRRIQNWGLRRCILEMSDTQEISWKKEKDA